MGHLLQTLWSTRADSRLWLNIETKPGASSACPDHGVVWGSVRAPFWRWLREAGPFKRAAAVAILIPVFVSAIVIRYLQWRWELPS